MKLNVIFLVLCTFQISANSYSQNAKVDLKMEDATLTDIFNEIEAQSEYRIFYRVNDLDLSKQYSVDFKNSTAKDVLDKVLDGSGSTFKCIDKIIVISSSLDEMQNIINGKVIDINNNPLPGVNIVEKGTTNGAVTNLDGEFSISISSPEAVLSFSYVGFLTEEIEVADQTTINITMIEDIQSLEEVVVVGYGTQKRSNLTGSVTDIKGDKLTKRTTMQTADALQGIATGVSIDASSGQPGSQSKIRVRGESSLTIGAKASKNDPLVLIDGVAGNINDVEPNDIESISVLKDAASSSIYGSRASNGVILIKTKRGKKGDFSVNYTVNMGFQVPTDLVDYTGAYEYMTHINEAQQNEGKDPIFSEEYIQNWQANQPSDHYPDVDWQDVVLKSSAFQQRHNLTVNGGTDKLTNLISLTYLDQDGIMPNTNYRRFGVRINSDIQATDRLHFGLDMQGTNADDKQPSQGVWYQLPRVKPNQLDRLSDGRYGPGYAGTNPLAMAHDGGLRKGNSKIGKINLKADYQFLDNLAMEVSFAPTYTVYESNSFTRMYDTYTWEGIFSTSNPAKNHLDLYFNKSQQIYANALLKYDDSFGKHNINIITGYDQTSYLYEWNDSYRDNFQLQDYQYLNAGDAENQQNSGSGHEWSLRSVFGRANYNFNEKYLFEANFRYDGSSRFSEGNKYSFFPSFSAGWRITEEDFMQKFDFISNLKLRGSWGMLGNQQIGVYPFLTTVDLNTDHDVVFGEQSHNGAAINEFSNSDIKWETSTMSNFGLDLGLFSNKFTVLFDYYIKRTEDILLRLPIPKTMGYDAPFQNAGVVENIGWDLTLDYNNRSGDFNYGVSFQLSDVKNEVIDLKDTGPYIDDVTIIREGEPINAIYGYEALGLFQTQSEVDAHPTQFGTVEPGDVKYKDQNDDGVIDAEDRVVLGNQIPRLSYSVDLTAEYKGFDARLFIQGIGDVDGYLHYDAIWAFHNGGALQQWQADDHWTPENTDAEYPRYWISYPNNQKVSSYWMRSAAYLRLKNVQIGYSLPSSWLSKIKISTLRIYLSGDNLLTIDDFYPGRDPELNLGNEDVHPFMTTYMLGINVKF